jgi:hypothetical protein
LLFNGAKVIDIFDCAKEIDKKFYRMYKIRVARAGKADRV